MGHLLSLWLPAAAGLIVGSRPARRLPARRALATSTDERWPAWTESIEADASLLYMPFLEHQLGVLERLGAVEEPSALEPRLSYAAKARAKGGLQARVGSRVFSVGGVFRRVRMTYFDGGHSLQVFNSLWCLFGVQCFVQSARLGCTVAMPRYPALDRKDAPLLGIDLLRFGPKKFLCVVDAQPPAGRDPTDGSVPHDTSALDAIRAAPGNDALRGEVSSKWYDDNRFFSNQMLYGRFQEGEAEVNDVLFPAFVDYLDAYVDLVSSAPLDPAHAEAARAGHADYDVFNAARDPAHGLFTSYFGEDWANDFVHDFLFESAPRTSAHE